MWGKMVCFHQVGWSGLVGWMVDDIFTYWPIGIVDHVGSAAQLNLSLWICGRPVGVSWTWLIAQLVSGAFRSLFSPMGNVPFCDCSQLCSGPKEEAKEASPLEIERLQAARQLFELTDLNGDGFISVEEFALMGLLQTKVHSESAICLAHEFWFPVNPSFRGWVKAYEITLNYPILGNHHPFTSDIVGYHPILRPLRPLDALEAEPPFLGNLFFFKILFWPPTSLHFSQEKKMTKEEEDQVRQIFVQRFGRDINSSFRPVPYAQYKEYLIWSVNSMDPGDLKADVDRMWFRSTEAPLKDLKVKNPSVGPNQIRYDQTSIKSWCKL